MPNELAEMILDDELRKEEIERGGDMPPCPRCGVPRVQRSDYVRCCRCGVNWMAGEDLSRDPRTQRFEEMMKTAPKAKQ